MSKIRIVTDSTADIPVAVREELGIEMVPLNIHFGSETYLDTITLTSEQFYDKLQASDVFPKTSQPSPAEFMAVYERLAAEEPDAEIISIHLASVLSGTYQSALIASSMLENIKVHVVDSRSASYGIGALVIMAAEAAKAGQSVEQIVQLIQERRDNFYIYFLVDTLEYLQKGGRIGKASALLGSLLNIKPILSIDPGGEVTAVEKVRGHKKAMARIVELLEQDIAGRPIRLYVAHANNPEGAEQLNELLFERFQVRAADFIALGPVIGAHAGPGTIAAFVSTV